MHCFGGDEREGVVVVGCGWDESSRSRSVGGWEGESLEMLVVLVDVRERLRVGDILARW